MLRTKTTLAIAAAVLAGAIGALRLRPDGSPSTAATPTVAESDEPRRDAPRSVAETGAAPAVNAPAAVPASTAAANDPAIDPLARDLADTVYDKLGPRFIDHLVLQGLSREDGEIIVVGLTRDLAACGLDALREQALAQGVAVDDVLYAVEATLHDADGPLVSALVDVEAVARREMPCSLNVLQQAGIAPDDVRRLILQPR